MKRLVFISYILIALISLPGIPPISAEGINSHNQPKTETLKQEEKPDMYNQCHKAQEGLWGDYQRLRDEFINGHISGKLRMKYEEFKMRQQALIDQYLEGKSKLLGKYFNDKEK